MPIQTEVVYADNNGTTKLRGEVRSCIAENLLLGWANPSAKNRDACLVRDLIAVARQRVGTLLSCSASEITFTSGGTESNNMVLWTISKLYTKPHIVISTMEHDSIILYARNLLQEGVIKLTEVELNSSGNLNAEDILNACNNDTRLVSVMLANNETGVLFPIHEISKCVKSKYSSILIHTDAAQAIGKVPVSVTELGVDYLTVVGHKFYGPRVGALYHHQTAPILPMFVGGGQENGLRSGTENTPMIVGLGLASHLAHLNLDTDYLQLLKCRDYLEQRLYEVFGDQLAITCKSTDRLPNTSNFALLRDNCSSANVLERVGFIASKGASCHSHIGKPSELLLKSGVKHEVALNCIRISFGIYNTTSDVDFIVAELVRVTDELANSKLSRN